MHLFCTDFDSGKNGILLTVRVCLCILLEGREKMADYGSCLFQFSKEKNPGTNPSSLFGMTHQSLISSLEFVLSPTPDYQDSILAYWVLIFIIDVQVSTWLPYSDISLHSDLHLQLSISVSHSVVSDSL